LRTASLVEAKHGIHGILMARVITKGLIRPIPLIKLI